MAHWINHPELSVNLDRIIWVTEQGDGLAVLHTGQFRFNGAEMVEVTLTVDGDKAREVLEIIGRADAKRRKFLPLQPPQDTR
jgi:hypothetical protein